MFSTCLLQCEENKPFHYVVHVFCPQCCMVPLPCWCMTCCVQKTSSQYPTAHPQIPILHRSTQYSLLSPTVCFFSLIIPYICSPHRPACPMTSDLSPWRTNHAFHSGNKREVFCLSVHICMLLPVICEMFLYVGREKLWSVCFDLFCVASSCVG